MKMKKAVSRWTAMFLGMVLLLTVVPCEGVSAKMGQNSSPAVDAESQISAEENTLAAEGAGDPANPVHHCTMDDDGTDTTVFSYIYFGSYPQSEVTDAATKTAIDSAIAGAGITSSGEGIDVTVGGVKYRRIAISDCNYDGYFDEVDNNGYRYFKWESIKWRVLQNDGSKLFVLADQGIDCKCYHDTLEAVTWETCNLRSWLDGNFYQTAFSVSERSAVLTRTIVNENNPEYGAAGGNDTSDPVFLLSLGEVTNPAYGFCSNYSVFSDGRRMKASDYANARGAWRRSSTEYFGNTHLMLRSPGSNNYDVSGVASNGYADRSGFNVSTPNYALCPALYLDLFSNAWSMSDDGSSGGDKYSSEVGGYCHADDIRLTVLGNKKTYKSDNDDYTICKNVEVILDSEEKITDNYGNVTISKSDTSAKIIFLNKNYVSREFTLKRLPSNGKINLQKKADGPVVSGVWVGNTDVYNEEYTINMLSKNPTTFEAEIDWGSGSYGSIRLVQDTKFFQFAGNTLTAVLSEKFNINEDIYIVATSKEGKVTRKKLKLSNGTTTDTTVSKAVDWANGMKVSFKDKLSFELPKSVKPSFMSGTKISISMDKIETIIPITISAKDGVIYAAIGADIVSYSKKKKDGETEKEVKNFIKSFKDTGIIDASGVKEELKKFNNFKKTYKDAIKKAKGSFGFDADFTVLGFAEGTYDENGKVTWIDGGVVLNPSVGASLDIPFSIPVIPIPLFFESSLKGDFTGKFYIFAAEDAKQFLPYGDIGGDIKLSAGVGAGVKKVFYGSGGGTGTLKPLYRIVRDGDNYFKLSASVNFYAKVGFLIWEGKLDFKPVYDEIWYEHPKMKSANIDAEKLACESENDGSVSIYDSSFYHLKDLSYLDKNAIDEELSPEQSELNSELPGIKKETVKSSIYKESTMQLLTLGNGKKMAVWIDAESSDPNGIALYYSLSDGASWSSPQQVHADGTMDSAPTAKVIGSKVYLAWQNATEVFDITEETALDDVVSKFDIAVAVFDEAMGFQTHTFQTEHLDMQPSIAGNENQVYVTWVNNGADNFFGAGEKNSILCASLQNGEWSEPNALYEELLSVDFLETDCKETLSVAYCLDTDGDPDTTEDRRLYENGERVSEEDVYESAPCYLNHELYWYCGQNVISREKKPVAWNQFSEQYGLCELDGKLAMVYPKSDGLYNQLMLSFYDDDNKCWSEGTKISDGEHFIGSFDIDAEGNGLSVLFNEAQVDGDITAEELEDPYRNSSLIFETVGNVLKPTVEEIYFNSADCKEEKMPVTVEVANHGTMPMDGVVVAIKDGSGAVLSEKQFEDVVYPGDKMVLDMAYDLPEGFMGQTYSAVVSPLDQKADIVMDDADSDFTINYQDVEVGEMTYAHYENGAVVISADVANLGVTERNHIVVALKNSTSDDERIEALTIETLGADEKVTVSFVMSEYEEGAYSIVIEEGGDEEYQANDSGFLFVPIMKPELPDDETGNHDSEPDESPSSQDSAASEETSVVAKPTAVQTPSAEQKQETIKGATKIGGEWIASKQSNTSIKKTKALKKSFKLTFKKVKSVKGYQIQYALDKKFKKSAKKKTITKNSISSVTIKKLKAKKKYYVRVRTYTTAKLNGKTINVYSKWSKAKTVKTK